MTWKKSESFAQIMDEIENLRLHDGRNSTLISLLIGITTTGKDMEKATPVEIRKSLEAAKYLSAAGIRFVPMPALNDKDHADLVAEMLSRFEEIEAKVTNAF